MKTKGSKWGNSVALRLPKKVAESQELTEGMDLEIKESDNGFFVRPASKSYSLTELLDGISKKILHSETLFDEPTGKEIW